MIILVVVSLVLLVLIGGVYIQTTRTQRFHTPAAQSDPQPVIKAIVEELRLTLQQDLDGDYEPYDYPWTDPAAERTVFDFDGEERDAAGAQGGAGDDWWLASTSPQFDTNYNGIWDRDPFDGDEEDPDDGTPYWGHISNLHGIFLNYTRKGRPADDIPANSFIVNENDQPEEHLVDFGSTGGTLPTEASGSATDRDMWLEWDHEQLVDADGDGIADSRWTYAPPEVRQRDGVTYLMAVRVVDLSSMVNINTASSLVEFDSTSGEPAWDTSDDGDAAPRWHTPSDINLGLFMMDDQKDLVSAALREVYDNGDEDNPLDEQEQTDDLGGMLTWRSSRAYRQTPRDPDNVGDLADLAITLPQESEDRETWWDQQGRFLEPQTPEEEEVRAFRMSDEYELRHRNGLNSPRRTPLESVLIRPEAVATSVDNDETDPVPPYFLRQLQPGDQGFEDDEGEVEYLDLLPSDQLGNQDDQDVILRAARNYLLNEPRHQMTTLSGASPFAARPWNEERQSPEWSGGGVTYEADPGPARVEPNPSLNTPGLDGNRPAKLNLNRTYRDAGEPDRSEGRVLDLFDRILRTYDYAGFAELTAVDAEQINRAARLTAAIIDYQDQDRANGRPATMLTEFQVPDGSEDPRTGNDLPDYAGESDVPDYVYGMEYLPAITEVYAQRAYTATAVNNDPAAAPEDATWTVTYERKTVTDPDDGSEIDDTGYMIEIRNTFDYPIPLEGIWLSIAADNREETPPSTMHKLVDLLPDEAEDPFLDDGQYVLLPHQVIVLYHDSLDGSDDPNNVSDDGNIDDTDEEDDTDFGLVGHEPEELQYVRIDPGTLAELSADPDEFNDFFNGDTTFEIGLWVDAVNPRGEVLADPVLYQNVEWDMEDLFGDGSDFDDDDWEYSHWDLDDNNPDPLPSDEEVSDDINAEDPFIQVSLYNRTDQLNPLLVPEDEFTRGTNELPGEDMQDLPAPHLDPDDGDPRGVATVGYNNKWSTLNTEWTQPDTLTLPSERYDDSEQQFVIRNGDLDFVGELLQICTLGPTPESAQTLADRWEEVEALPENSEFSDTENLEGMFMLNWDFNDPATWMNDATAVEDQDNYSLPYEMALLDQFTVLQPEESMILGQVNLNTMPQELLAEVLPIANEELRREVAWRIASYRDLPRAEAEPEGQLLPRHYRRMVDPSDDGIVDPEDTLRPDLPGFAFMGELLWVTGDIFTTDGSGVAFGPGWPDFTGETAEMPVTIGDSDEVRIDFPTWDVRTDGIDNDNDGDIDEPGERWNLDGDDFDNDRDGQTDEAFEQPLPFADGVADDREEAAMMAKWLMQVGNQRSDCFAAYVLLRGYRGEGDDDRPFTHDDIVDAVRFVAIFRRYEDSGKVRVEHVMPLSDEVYIVP
ncbi:MAG: hypothetical protein ACLFVN_05910 [Phycisphaeraceae bacterium]